MRWRILHASSIPVAASVSVGNSEMDRWFASRIDDLTHIGTAVESLTAPRRKHMARAMRGSHCVRFKKVKGKRRCAAFARGKRGGKRRGKRRKALRDVFGFAGLGAHNR